MKLTAIQVEMRTVFRNAILEHWRDNKRPLMFGTVHAVKNHFSLSTDEAREEMSKVPSIGKFRMNMPVQAWLASHYRQVSNALFDGATDEKALAIWKVSKRTDGEPKRTREEAKEGAKTNKSHRKFRALAELRNNMGDRWGATSWGKVK